MKKFILLGLLVINSSAIAMGTNAPPLLGSSPVPSRVPNGTPPARDRFQKPSAARVIFESEDSGEVDVESRRMRKH